MTDIKLVGLDLDGTLLDDNRHIRPRSIKALKDASAAGINLAIISGRNYLAVPEEIRKLTCVRYYVLCNGAALYDAWEDKIIYEAAIPLHDAIEIYHSMEEEEVFYDCYLNEGAWTQREHYDRIDEFVPVESHRAFLKVSRTAFSNLCDALRQRGKPIWKIQSIYKSTEIRNKERIRLSGLYPQYGFCSAYPYNLEINNPAANKGAGLMRLANMLTFTTQQVMAFGDGENDAPMLRDAGVGIAMGNAAKEALNAAKFVGPRNTEDGVAQVLEALTNKGAPLEAVLHRYR